MVYLQQKPGLRVKGESLGAGQSEEGGIMQVHISSKGAESGVHAAWRTVWVIECIAAPALQRGAALQRDLLLHCLPEVVHPCDISPPTDDEEAIHHDALLRIASAWRDSDLQMVLMRQRLELQLCSLNLCCTAL